MAEIFNTFADVSDRDEKVTVRITDSANVIRYAIVIYPADVSKRGAPADFSPVECIFEHDCKVIAVSCAKLLTDYFKDKRKNRQENENKIPT